MIPQASLKGKQKSDQNFSLSQDQFYPRTLLPIPDGDDEKLSKRWFLSAGPVIFTPYLEMLILLLFLLPPFH